MAVSDVTPSSQTVAVRPPEYWPRLAYMALVQAVDCVVLADTFQYSRQSFQNRARLRNPQGWQWISIPLKGGQHGTGIDEVRLRHHLPWQRTHRRALLYNYRTAPYYPYVEDRLHAVLEREWTHLGTLTCKTVEVLADALGLSTRIRHASALPGAPTSIPEVLAVLGPSTLIVPEPVADIDAEHAERSRVFQFDHPSYRQNFEGFEPGMSALDLLLNYGPESAGMLARSTQVSSSAPEITRTESG
ncbi:MAG: hypothetical protein GVY18_10755 [Bacteroidetes bacterium]|nr:hypothetical protein [Bacteroidota bacterium]